MKESIAIAVSTSERHRQQALMLVRWFLLLAMVAVTSATVMGQGRYEVKKINPKVEEPATYKMMTNAVKSFARSPKADNPSARYATYYFTTYVPSKLTDPKLMPEYSTYLEDVTKHIKTSLRANEPGDNKTTVMGWVYSGMKAIAQGNHHPAGRITAISYLSKIEYKPEDRAAKSPPVLIPNVPTDLLPIYQDKKAPDGVRAAALQGLHRFAILNTAALRNPTRATLVTEMKTLLAAKPPTNRNPAAHAYLQRFAVDILSVLKPVSDPVLAKSLVSISSTTANHDLIALHSAAAIGGMAADLKGTLGPTNDLLGAWSVRAMRNFQYEIGRLNALERPSAVPGQPISPESLVSEKNTAPTQMGGGMDGESMEGGGMMGYDESMSDPEMGMEMGMEEMGMMGMMGRGMMGVNPPKRQPPEVFLSRRKLNHMLEQLHRGAAGRKEVGVPEAPAGLLAAVDPADKQLVEAWLTKMEEVVTALNDTSLETRALYIEALDAQVAVLRDLAGPAAAAAAAAAAPIKLPGVSGPVATSVIPDAPVLDPAGAPTFPAGLDELSPE